MCSRLKCIRQIRANYKTRHRVGREQINRNNTTHKPRKKGQGQSANERVRRDLICALARTPTDSSRVRELIIHYYDYFYDHYWPYNRRGVSLQIAGARTFAWHNMQIRERSGLQKNAHKKHIKSYPYTVGAAAAAATAAAASAGCCCGASAVGAAAAAVAFVSIFAI